MKHLLSTRDLARADAIALLDIAEDMAATQFRSVKKLPTLLGKTVVNLFCEDSRAHGFLLRRRRSVSRPMLLNFSASGSSASKGECLKDTAQTLHAMGADAIVLRHHASGAAHVLAESNWVPCSIVNAGDGTHEHPTQALLDAFTIRRSLLGDASRGRDLADISVVIVGDIVHSRVARSNMWLLNTLGARVTFVAPATLIPFGAEKWPATVRRDLDAVLADESPDVLMMLRVQSERMAGAYFPTAREYARLWGLDEARLCALRPGSIVMHPGPMNRGLKFPLSPLTTPARPSANRLPTEFLCAWQFCMRS